MSKTWQVKTIFFALIVSSLISVGCSKKDEAPTSVQAAGILSRIPPTSAGFFSWSTQGAEYQKLRKEHWSDWTSSMLKSLEESAQQLGPDQAEKIKSIVTVFDQSGLVSKSPDQPDPIKEAVLFVDFGPQNNTPSFGLFVEGYPHVNFETLLASAEPVLKQQQIQVEASTANGRKIVKVVPPNTPNQIDHIFLVGTKDKLAIVSPLSAADRLFDEVKEDGFKVVSSTPIYQKGTKLLNSNGEQFAFGYVDITKIASYVKGLPEIQNKAEIDTLPLQSFAISQAVKDGVNVRGVFTLEPKDDKQKLLLTNLSKKPENNLVEGTPEDSALLIAVDKQLLQTVKEGALSEVTPEEKQAAAAYMEMIDGIKGLGVMLRQGAGDSPFPDLAIIAQTSSIDKTYQAVKGMLLDTLGAQLGIEKWMEKDIEGTKVNYVMTPFGVGMYLTASGDKLIVTSTDSAMQKVLATSKKGSGSLAAKIKAQSANTEGFLTYYVSFNALAQLIEAVQGSMAMFTGGATGFDVAEIQNLKRLGNAFGGVSIQEGSVVLDGIITYAPKQG